MSAVWTAKDDATVLANLDALRVKRAEAVIAEEELARRGGGGGRGGAGGGGAEEEDDDDDVEVSFFVQEGRGGRGGGRGGVERGGFVAYRQVLRALIITTLIVGGNPTCPSAAGEKGVGRCICFVRGVGAVYSFHRAGGGGCFRVYVSLVVGSRVST